MKSDATRRANTQMIHICHTGLFHSHLLYIIKTIMDNWVASYNFTMTAKIQAFLWPCVNTKVIQTGIKLQSLVMPSIRPRLKQIGLHVSRHRTMLTVSFIKSCQQSSLPLNYLHKNRFSISLYITCTKINLAWASTNQQVVTTDWISSKPTVKIQKRTQKF